MPGVAQSRGCPMTMQITAVVPEPSNDEFLESEAVVLEWRVRGLKDLFDASAGTEKSKVVRSIRFGGGRWQILFYPNAGRDDCMSLYLSYVPTEEEKMAAIDGKWMREGPFKFKFELHSLSKGTCLAVKEAVDHSFSHASANWGWADFAKRDTVFYSCDVVTQQDAFHITCTVTYPPSPLSTIPKAE